MRQVERIIANDKEILYLDFSGLKTKEDILKQTEIFGRAIRSNPYRSVVTLTNIEDMHFNKEIYSFFSDYVKANNPYVVESAVIGMKGMMQIFYKGFVALTGRKVKVCDTMTEAILALSGSTSYRFANSKATSVVEQI